MSIFQKSIVKKHISSENQEVLKEKWKLFTSYFHNATIQENIHNSKEEQFQEGFLRELFVKVLGYTLNPEPNFNLTTEYKNIKDSKKADGAIIINNIVTAVIELKGTATTDLGKVESQAFNYKNNQHQCVYVITSNFEKLRFYIDNAIEHIEFNLFKLTEEEFQLLYLCLAFKNIENNVPKNIKDESVSQEDVITKKLYNDYSLFKRELHHNLVALNPGNDPLELFQKSQKLLDRFLFIFFAEDRGLLPTNLIFRINKEWQQLREMRIDVSLYDRYKIYFSDLNVGAKVSLPAFSQTVSNKKDEFQIYAYNGGLFKEDDELNTLKIDDALLFKHTEKLSNYDFASEVDVNILGHIFENSLNELDEIKAQIEGQEIDKTKTKRKKDGVFYTPKYITKYIVDNTVGKLCSDKKVEFKISEEEYITDKKRNKTTIQNLAAKLSNYRNWLLQITICDPACGSGAFLNQALDFLINEHKYIDELHAKLFGDAFVLSDVEGSILENNLFGVDINEESVEIAKLSLWLRTAQPNRKLNDLNSNIKCGNSLIDDITIAGEKAFNWQLAFPNVFENKGFDIIIGNPPYVNIYNMNSLDRDYFNLSDKYSSTYLKYDLYVLFIEKALKLLKANGVMSYIIPSVILSVPYGKLIREKIIKENTLLQIVDFTGFKVFSDAMVESCILLISKTSSIDSFVKIFKPKLNVADFQRDYIVINQNEYLATDSFQFRLDLNNNSLQIIDKIKKQSVSLESIYYVSKGIVAFSKIDNRKKDDFIFDKIIDEKCQPFLEGKDVNRYYIGFENKYLQYDETIMSRPTFPELHTHNKLLIRAISDGLNATYDDKGYYIDQKLIICSKRFEIENYITPAKRPKSEHLNSNDIINDLSILALLNSKLSSFYYNVMLKGGVSILPEDIRNFPIYLFKTAQEQTPFIEKAGLMLSLNNEVHDQLKKLQRTLQRKFELIDLTKKLEDWYLLSFSDFIKELTKKKIKLSLSEEAEWEEYFNLEAKKTLELKSKIDATDKEIDQMVYKLYDLTEEEIKIVEG